MQANKNKGVGFVMLMQIVDQQFLKSCFLGIWGATGTLIPFLLALAKAENPREYCELSDEQRHLLVLF